MRRLRRSRTKAARAAGSAGRVSSWGTLVPAISEECMCSPPRVLTTIYMWSKYSAPAIWWASFERVATGGAEARAGGVGLAADAAMDARDTGEQALAAGGAEPIDGLIRGVAGRAGDVASSRLRAWILGRRNGWRGGGKLPATGRAETLCGCVGLPAARTYHRERQGDRRARGLGHSGDASGGNGLPLGHGADGRLRRDGLFQGDCHVGRRLEALGRVFFKCFHYNGLYGERDAWIQPGGRRHRLVDV